MKIGKLLIEIWYYTEEFAKIYKLGHIVPIANERMPGSDILNKSLYVNINLNKCLWPDISYLGKRTAPLFDRFASANMHNIISFDSPESG